MLIKLVTNLSWTYYIDLIICNTQIATSKLIVEKLVNFLDSHSMKKELMSACFWLRTGILAPSITGHLFWNSLSRTLKVLPPYYKIHWENLKSMFAWYYR